MSAVLPKGVSGTGALSGAPRRSPETKTQVAPAGHGAQPSDCIRQVLVKGVPVSKEVPSGTVTSVTKAAPGRHGVGVGVRVGAGVRVGSGVRVGAGVEVGGGARVGSGKSGESTRISKKLKSAGNAFFSDFWVTNPTRADGKAALCSPIACQSSPSRL